MASKVGWCLLLGGLVLMLALVFCFKMLPISFLSTLVKPFYTWLESYLNDSFKLKAEAFSL